MAGVSVLEIGGTNQKQAAPTSFHSNTGNAVHLASIKAANIQKLDCPSGFNVSHSSASTTPATSSVFQSINQQQRQLDGLRNSLSEDMERFRVHSNGQLLDLLMRQNWCESVISEKIKALELSGCYAHQQCRSIPQPECQLRF